MKMIESYPRHAMEAFSRRPLERLQLVQEWTGVAVRLIQNIPQALAEHPNAFIAAVTAVNGLFFIALNKTIHRFEPKSEQPGRNFKVIFISESLGFAAVYGFNRLLSKAVPLTQQTMIAIAASSLVLRILLVRLWDRSVLPASSPEDRFQGSPVLKRLDSPSVLDEELLSQDGTPSKTSESQFESPSRHDPKAAAILKKEWAKKKKLEMEKALTDINLNERVADLEIEIADLKEENKKVKAAAEKAEKELAREKKQFESKITMLKDENEQLSSSCTSSEKAYKAEKKESETECQKLRDLGAALSLAKAELEKELQQAREDLEKAKVDQTGGVLSRQLDQLEQEKKQVESELEAMTKKHQKLQEETNRLAQRVEELEQQSSSSTTGSQDPTSQSGSGAKSPPPTSTNGKDPSTPNTKAANSLLM